MMPCALPFWKGLHSHRRPGDCSFSCSGEGFPSRLPCAGFVGPRVAAQLLGIARVLTWSSREHSLQMSSRRMIICITFLERIGRDFYSKFVAPSTTGVSGFVFQ